MHLVGQVVETVDGDTRMYMMPFSEHADGGGGDGSGGGQDQSAGNQSMWQLSWRMDEPEARRLAAGWRDHSKTIFYTLECAPKLRESEIDGHPWLSFSCDWWQTQWS